MQQIIDVLALSRADIPFVLLYALEAKGREASLFAAAGMSTHWKANPVNQLVADDHEDIWRFHEVLEKSSALQVNTPQKWLDYFACEYPAAVEVALIKSLRPAEGAAPEMIMILGTSPGLALNEEYRNFLDQVFAWSTRALGQAITYEQRVHSDERMKAYLSATTDAVYVMSPDWTEMRQLSGAGFLADTPESNPSWLEPYIPEEARPAVLLAIRSAIDAGSMFQLEHQVLRGDGSVAWTLSKAVPLKDDQGRITEWVGAATDISVLKQNQELRNAVAERDALLKEVHHRVKNNLQVITSLLEMQSHQVHNARAAELFEDACNRVGSIAVIHEMLYQSGSFSKVDLCAYAQRLVPYLVSFFEAQRRIAVEVRGVEVIIDLEQAVPCGLLLNELVSNSCKHAFPDGGSGKLCVSLNSMEDQFRITVKDSGVGLPASFDLDQSPALGLKIVKTLAEQLKANVAFGSTEGLSVEVTVPFLKRSPPDASRA